MMYLVAVVAASGRILLAQIDTPETVLACRDPEPIQPAGEYSWLGFVNDEADFEGAEPNALATWIMRSFGWQEGPRILHGPLVLIGRDLDGLRDLPLGVLAELSKRWPDNFGISPPTRSRRRPQGPDAEASGPSS